ncbi:helix-turn-helix domain-containing protein [Acaryochloris sp. IP29b_bin.148]|uniref:helix-turn-helix domain-containing protein n=1 Tax=Acaryochloris sp. IP29b_bin.148 TaxID=2969218 RepID=UPI00263A29A1|nr:helix-turn-helix domain-containing protein [Acaryochloris sp. IP29b_bin.148]
MTRNQQESDIPAYLKAQLSNKQMSVYQLSQRTGISRDYLSRLFNHKINKPGIDKLQQIASVLEFELSELLPCNARPPSSDSIVGLSELGYYPGSIPGLQNPCIGRQQDLALCSQWLLEKSTKILGLWGLAGIGKTSLGIAFVQQIQSSGNPVIWLDATHPSTQAQLQQGVWPETLLQTFQSKRLVLVIDQLEAIRPHPPAAHSMSTVPHLLSPLLSLLNRDTCQSHLILISRNKPQWMSLMERQGPFMQTLQLKGLKSEVDQFLQQQGLADADYWPDLIQLYRGHPLALKLAVGVIQTVFAGSVKDFLQQETLFLGDLTPLLQEQVQHLPEAERHLLYTFTERAEPMSFPDIQELFKMEWRKSELMQALNLLISQSLIETAMIHDTVFYILQPFVRQSLRRPIGLSLNP